MSGQFFSDELPDYLKPYKGLLSPRFYEVRRKIVAFLTCVSREARGNLIAKRTRTNRDLVRTRPSLRSSPHALRTSLRSSSHACDREVIIPANATYKKQREALIAERVKLGAHPLSAPQPAVLAELRAEAKARGLWNFFLPDVVRLLFFRW